MFLKKCLLGKESLLSCLTAALILVMCLAAGCGENSEPSTTPEPTATPTVSESPEEKDELDGYEESDSPNDLDPTREFKLSGDVSKETPEDPYSNTYKDGSLLMWESLEDGTPYDFGGMLYDSEYFDMKTYSRRNDGDPEAVGSGTSYVIYRLIPKKSGETEAVCLRKYFASEGDVYEGTFLHIRIDKKKKCKIDWYVGVDQGKNLEIK